MAKKIISILVCSLVLFLFWNHQVIAPTAEPDWNLPLTEQKPKITTVLAVGDILLSRHVGAQIDKSNNPNLPYALLRDLLNSADITFGNLECPLADSSIPIREGLIFRCLTKYVPGLVNAGFDVLSTANNHAMDQGLDNLEFTIDYLKSQNIVPVGTGEMKEEIIERNGILFGFLAYSYSAFNDGKSTTHPQIATLPSLSPPFQGGGEEGVLQSDIANLKSRGANIVIVSMHAGTEYTRKPNQEQIDFARAAIDSGADIVIGHHPHWIQTIEIYNGKPIFYSLGNFIFDQEWSRETKEGLMVELSFEAHELRSAKLIPVIIQNFCCPRLATEEEKTIILNKINLKTDIINLTKK